MFNKTADVEIDKEISISCELRDDRNKELYFGPQGGVWVEDVSEGAFDKSDVINGFWRHVSIVFWLLWFWEFSRYFRGAFFSLGKRFKRVR